ncbi:MAG TPA: efflux RND transporter periplasmic adaptor subunit [Bryobacteraceae bacterium]|nr:efflux RND transporter periplasmic adaptor subunit [Bryobacteraceae bacterium]
MKAFSTLPIRAKTWAAFACLAVASLAIHGCTGSTTADSNDPGGGKGSGKTGGKGGGRRSFDGGGPVPVVTAKVTQRDVPIEVSVVGNVEAYATISMIPQISGQLVEVAFGEGDYVRKNQKLFTIDPRPLQAQLAQSKAQLARDQALLNQAEANLKRDDASLVNARTEAGRYASLFEQKIVSREQVDQYKTTADTLAQSLVADRAAIESAKATIASDQAAIDTVALQLAYTIINSPIDGKTGNLMIKQGSIVSANSTVLIAITQIEPTYVTFAVPENNLADIKKYSAQGKLSVQAITQEADAVKEKGALTFIDNNVDMTTGTIKLKGTFPNTDHKLWPGQYVNVVLRLTTRPNALVVPNQAVQSGQDGSFVYVVGDNRRVQAKPVVTGPRVDQDLVIDKGLEEGETVVTEGQLRLAPGSMVTTRDPNAPPGDGGGRGRGQGSGDGKGSGDGQGKGRGKTS